MQTLDILWVVVLFAVALVAGISSREDSVFGPSFSVVMSALAVVVAWPAVAWLYHWWKSVIPLPDSDLHSFTALLMTSLFVLAFVSFNAAFPAYLHSLLRCRARRASGKFEVHKCRSQSSA